MSKTTNDAPDMETESLAIGVILHEKGDGSEKILADFAFALRQAGVDVGGLVQHSTFQPDGRRRVDLIDVRTRETFCISQDLGPDSRACILDLAGLADASQVLRREIEAGVVLLIVNQFAKMESEGRGLAPEAFEAVGRGIPVLTSLSTRYRAQWDALSEGAGQMLEPTPEALWAWWKSVARD
jgi:uncharacterized protein